MELKPIIFLGFILLCWISVVSTHDGHDERDGSDVIVTVTLKGHTVTGPITELVDILRELGVRIPPQVRAILKRNKIDVEPESPRTLDSKGPAEKSHTST